LRAGSKKKGEWRFIYTGKNDAFFNMALDEALLILSEEKNTPPVLRLYQWEPKAVSIGYSQVVERTLDLRKCRKMNVDVVRRITGGRAVLHDDDLTYSICASKDYFTSLGESINETYKRISLAFLKSLSLLKIEGDWEKKSQQENRSTPFSFSEPCFSSSSKYEIKVDGKKLIGSAQRRFGNSFVQHGSIGLKDQSLDLVDLLPDMDKEKKEKAKTSSGKYFISIQALLGTNPQVSEIISAIKSGFGSFFSVDLVDGQITACELEMTRRLITKYESDDWNHRRQM
jgi:lipoate-protein ligase A